MNLSTNPEQPATPNAGTTGRGDKFMFSRSFDLDKIRAAEEAIRAVQNPTVTMTVAEFESARVASFAEGVTAGRQESEGEQLAHISVIVQQLTKTVQSLSESTKARQTEQAAVVTLAVKAIVQKALPHYFAQHGYAEIQAVITDTLRQLHDEPRLVIRVADQHLDLCIKNLNGIATAAAFEGKLVILADSQLGPSDCRVEWADGGLERLEDNLWASLDRALSHRLGVTTTHAYEQNDTTTPVGGNHVNATE